MTPPPIIPVHKVLSCGPLDLRDEIPGKGFSFTVRFFFFGGAYAGRNFFCLNDNFLPWKIGSAQHFARTSKQRVVFFFQMSYENTTDIIVVCFFLPISLIVCIPCFPIQKKLGVRLSNKTLFHLFGEKCPTLFFPTRVFDHQPALCSFPPICHTQLSTVAAGPAAPILGFKQLVNWWMFYPA